MTEENYYYEKVNRMNTSLNILNKPKKLKTFVYNNSKERDISIMNNPI